MTSIGILGAGISGLHLTLMLQQNGVETVLYASDTPEQMRNGPLLNNVCRFGRTQERERELGVSHWDFDDFAMYCAHVRIHADPPVAFCGRLSQPGSFVDFRIYLPRLMQDYIDRGGEVVQVPLEATVIDDHIDNHDLFVVAAGGRRFGDVFPRDPNRSTQAPQRLLLAGLFDGVDHTEPMGLHFDIVPGSGEIFQSPVHAVTGRVAGITFEAIPGGPWADAVRQKEVFEDDEKCAATVLDLLRSARSEILDRVDVSTFSLTRPLDLLQGSIVPTVRTPWTNVSKNGKSRFVVAVGDAAVINDPVTGQGANLGSASAWELGRAILSDRVYDERFCRRWEQTSWSVAQDVTAWTNAALGAPPPHVLEFFSAAAELQPLADAFLDNFDDPTAMWNALATPQRAEEFVRHVTLNSAEDANDNR